MHTLIIDGHPNPDSLCAAIAAAYHEGNPSADLIAVRDLDFNPSLNKGLTAPQPLEPDLTRVRSAIETAAHLVVVTPTWWASTPSGLKGLFDRVFTPDWAYTYRPLPEWANRIGMRGGIPQGLLTGRTGRLLITSDSPDWLLRLNGDHAVKVLAKHVLGFSGIRPVAVTRFGGVRWTTPSQRADWLVRTKSLGKKDTIRLDGATARTRTASAPTG